MNIKSSKTLVTEALSEIKTISPDEALSMMNEDKCIRVSAMRTKDINIVYEYKYRSRAPTHI